MTPMQLRFRRLWFWSHDDAPAWFAAYAGQYAWRPWCWARGYHEPHHCDVHFEVCTWCLALIWSRSRDGGRNPVGRAARVPASWRRLHPLGRGEVALMAHDEDRANT